MSTERIRNCCKVGDAVVVSLSDDNVVSFSRLIITVTFVGAIRLQNARSLLSSEYACMGKINAWQSDKLICIRKTDGSRWCFRLQLKSDESWGKSCPMLCVALSPDRNEEGKWLLTSMVASDMLKSTSAMRNEESSCIGFGNRTVIESRWAVTVRRSEDNGAVCLLVEGSSDGSGWIWFIR